LNYIKVKDVSSNEIQQKKPKKAEQKEKITKKLPKKPPFLNFPLSQYHPLRLPSQTGKNDFFLNIILF